MLLLLNSLGVVVQQACVCILSSVCIQSVLCLQYVVKGCVVFGRVADVQSIVPVYQCLHRQRAPAAVFSPSLKAGKTLCVSAKPQGLTRQGFRYEERELRELE